MEQFHQKNNESDVNIQTISPVFNIISIIFWWNVESNSYQ